MGEKMRRLLPPDKAVLETQISGVVYRQQKDGTIHADDHDYSALKKAGYTEPMAGGFAKAAGWVCLNCGFHGYFKLCGKCKSENTERGK